MVNVTTTSPRRSPSRSAPTTSPSARTPAIERFGEHSMVQEFVPLAARCTALRDMAARRPSDRVRQGRVTDGPDGGA